MKALFKLLLGAALVAGIFYGIDTFRGQTQPEPEPEIIRPVRTITLQGGKDSFKRKYFGTVQGGKRADLSFRVSGTLNKVNAEKGSHVKRGALLATLDPRDFNTRISQAQSALSQAQAQYKNAQADFKRYENLYKQRVIARAQYDTYKTQVDVTESAVSSANANLKSARDALKDTELRAPFEGVITDRMVENFQDVTAKQTIFNIQDFSTLEIVFNIPDNDVLLAPLPKVKSLRDIKSHADSFAINARFEAIPDRVFPLSIKEVSTQATATNTYPVTATMPDLHDLRVLPGMAVTVEVDLLDVPAASESDNNLLVPTTAILNEGGKNFVWRFANGSVTKIPVTLGEIRNDSSIVIEGDELHGGDIIVTAGVYFLHEGQHVRLSED